MARKTNTEALTDLMEFARSGPLMQAFVLHAISHYAEKCAAQDPATFDNPFMSGRAWHACAIEARDHINKHLGD